MNPERARTSLASPAAPAAAALGRDVIILMYHHCATRPPDAVVPGLYVTPEQFAWQMDWLRDRDVAFCTFADLEGPGAETASPRVMLTFDDGFRDNYEHAWPILKERHIPAVVYPVVGDIGKSGVVWEENTDRSPQTLLTVDQIREMAAGGIEFGSHLLDHRRANRMEPEELRHQLTGSRESLSQITGRDVLSTAYPFGAYSPQVVEETLRCGYRYAVTTHEGPNQSAPRLELRRYAIRGTKWHHRWRFTHILRKALAGAAA